MNPVNNDINPITLIILGISLVVLIIFTLFKISQNVRLLRSRRSNQIDRIKNLKLSRMLEYLNIPFSQYLHNTSELDKERHMWACKNCQHPKQCKRLLEGEALNIKNICPNYPRLKDLQKTSPDTD